MNIACIYFVHIFCLTDLLLCNSFNDLSNLNRSTLDEFMYYCVSSQTTTIIIMIIGHQIQPTDVIVLCNASPPQLIWSETDDDECETKQKQKNQTMKVHTVYHTCAQHLSYILRELTFSWIQMALVKKINGVMCLFSIHLNIKKKKKRIIRYTRVESSRSSWDTVSGVIH